MTDTDIIRELYEVVRDRRDNPREDSYTTDLLEHEDGVDAVLEKINEESFEVALAAKNEDRMEVVHESADLVYHLLVLLVAMDVDIDSVLDELRDRRG